MKQTITTALSQANDSVFQIVTSLCIAWMILDMTLLHSGHSPSSPALQSNAQQTLTDQNIDRSQRQRTPADVAASFRQDTLVPYLESITSHALTACNASTEEVQQLFAKSQGVLRSKQQGERAAKDAMKGHSGRGGVRTGGAHVNSIEYPWYASVRFADSTRSHRATDFATMTGSVDGFMSRYLSPERTDGISENITFATNTVDKLVYQLDNFEPLHHKFSSPQWNGISLQAQRRLGATFPKAFIIGISSVNRQTNYLVSTLVSMLTALDDEEKRMIHIVVFNGNFPPERHEDIASVRIQFADEISSGLIEIVEMKGPHKELHDPSKLTQRWGDSLDRVQWRSKQVLDVSALMQYCTEHVNPPGAPNGYHYFLMMEDDIVSSKHFVRRLRAWVDSHVIKKSDWTMLSFYNPWPVQDMEQLPPNKFFGVIGQLFRLHDLPVVVEFLKKNFDQSPLDWLFVDFLKKMSGTITVHTPSLFQHQGTVSSLDGKRQSGQSVDFVAQEG